MKDVVIKIVGTQDYGQNEPDSVELVTDGKFSYSEGCAQIKYSESELTGLEGTETFLSVCPTAVSMRRRGNLTSSTEFRLGERSAFLYETPYGNATMGVDTRKINVHMDENGGSLLIEYVVDMDHAVYGKNCFQLYVTEQERMPI